jgi:hypothetical protein
MQVGAARQRLRVRTHRLVSGLFTWGGRTTTHCRRVLCALWQALVPPPHVSSPTAHAYSLPDGVLTPVEAERLTAFRTRVLGRTQYLEYELSERRLQFARWLVQHGHLTDFPAHPAPTSRKGHSQGKHELIRPDWPQP